MADRVKHEIIYPTNLLRDRVTGAKPGQEELVMAERAVDRLAGRFQIWLPAQFRQVEATLRDLEAEPEGKEHKKALQRLVNDLRGVAGVFDYMFITLIGGSLCRFLERSDTMTHRHLVVARLHFEAMQHVFEEKITGSTSARGQRIIRELQKRARNQEGEKVPGLRTRTMTDRTLCWIK